MSISLTIYVGPFLQCRRISGIDAYDLADGRLCDLRGELSGDDGEFRYIGPNTETPGIDRQLRFRRHDNLPVVADINQGDERSAFIDQFNADIAAIHNEYGSATVAWGVVPGYF